MVSSTRPLNAPVKLSEKSPYQKARPYLLAGLAVWFLVQLLGILLFNGTYDSGDSIQHFMFARYAPEHPENLLDHWAKPLFTLLAMPFAGLGFTGMKLFNCLAVLGTAWWTARIALRMRIPWGWAAPILLLAAPEMFRVQFSGLTEPLFGLLLAFSVWQLLNRNWAIGLVAASFLPFVRTEGFLLLPIFGLLLLELTLRKQMKPRQLFRFAPLLAFGTVIYSLVGGWFKGDLLWVFTQNPYSNAENYGIGDWAYFPEKYIYLVGLPLFILWCLGMVLSLVSLLSKKVPFLQRSGLKPLFGDSAIDWRWLIYGPFLVYFGAHMVFWATGTAHSMGLMRVLLALGPLSALICLRGLAFLLAWLPVGKAQQIGAGLVLAFVLVFPFLPNPASLDPKDLFLTHDQEILWEVSENTPQFSGPLYSQHPYAAFVFDRDPFDETQFHVLVGVSGSAIPKGAHLLWDSWFAVREAGFSEKEFADPARFEVLFSAESVEKKQELRIKFCKSIAE